MYRSIATWCFSFRLFLTHSSFITDVKSYVEIPPTGQMVDGIRYGKIEEPTESGRYIVVFANCNDLGREVLVSGAAVWKSAHGYLPGELFHFFYFYVVLTLVYAGLLAGYVYSMNKYAEARIPIEKWIAGTIFMGLLECFFRTGESVTDR